MTEEQELPEGWKKTTLGEICEIFDNKRIPLNSEQRNQRISNKSSDELFPYYGATGEVGKIDDFIFDGEFVLLGEDAAPFFEPTKNVAYIAKGKFWVNNHAHILSSSILENSYICHYLNQFNFSGYVSGTTRLKLSQGAMKKIPFVYPIDKETQQSIVNKIESLFTEIDAGIASLKNAQRQLVQYRQALLKNAFNGELTKAWREQNAQTLPSAEELLTQIQTAREQHHTEQIKQWESAVKKWELSGKEGKKPSKPKALTQAVKFEESFADLPRGWFETKFGDVCEVFVGSTPSRKHSEYWNGNIFWVSSGEVKFSNIFETKEKITQLGISNSSTTIHPIGTVMLAMIGEGKTRGQTGILKIEASHNQNTAAIRINKEYLLSEYIYYFFMFNYEQTRRIGSGNNQKALNKSIVENMFFPICSLAEQTQIVAILEQKLTACDQLATELATQLKQAELLKQAVLKAAFSGGL